jgi:phosphoglycolate phosphatase-like HAD superfamily hydrolase
VSGAGPLAGVDGLVLDLDGVVVDSSRTYRKGYLLGMDAWLREERGLEPVPPAGRATLISMEDIYAIKAHPAFNTPLATTSLLVAFALRHVGPDSVGPLPALADWMAGIAPWPPTLDGWLTLLDAGEGAVDRGADALRTVREFYAGDDLVERLYGYTSRHPRGRGLCHDDGLLVDPARPAPPMPLAVFTGREEVEARMVLDRVALLRDLPDGRFWHRTRGVAKPDPTLFAECLDQLGVSCPLYVGDVAADAELVARYRALGRKPKLRFALIGDECPAERADCVFDDLDALLDALAAANPAP